MVGQDEAAVRRERISACLHAGTGSTCTDKRTNAPATCLRRLEDRRRTFGLLDWLAFFVPFVGWIRTYNPAWLQSDVLAGLSVACMEIPQVGPAL